MFFLQVIGAIIMVAALFDSDDPDSKAWFLCGLLSFIAGSVLSA